MTSLWLLGPELGGAGPSAPARWWPILLVVVLAVGFSLAWIMGRRGGKPPEQGPLR